MKGVEKSRTMGLNRICEEMEPTESLANYLIML